VTDTLPDTRTPQPHDAIFSKSDAEFVGQMLSRITDREARVLKMRFGLSHGRRMTLKEIGEAVGLTRERVRQIEKEAKRKLEEYVREYV
jgi:RNA polymerase primary sigma factor